MNNKNLPPITTIIIYLIVSFILFLIFLNSNNDLNFIGNIIAALLLGIPTTIVLLVGHIVIERIINYK